MFSVKTFARAKVNLAFRGKCPYLVNMNEFNRAYRVKELIAQHTNQGEFWTKFAKACSSQVGRKVRLARAQEHFDTAKDLNKSLVFKHLKNS